MNPPSTNRPHPALQVRTRFSSTFHSSAIELGHRRVNLSFIRHTMAGQITKLFFPNQIGVNPDFSPLGKHQPTFFQPWPQQFKYMTRWRDSSAWIRLSSQLPITPATSDPMEPPESGRRRPMDLKPDFHLCPWSVWPWLTTAKLAAVHTWFK